MFLGEESNYKGSGSRMILIYSSKHKGRIVGDGAYSMHVVGGQACINNTEKATW